MPRYWICEEVYACMAGDIVWLDSRNGKYLRIASDRSHILAQLIHGWPPCIAETSQRPPMSPQKIEEFAENLIVRGLLTRSFSGGKRFKPPTIEAPSRSFDSELVAAAPKISWRHAVRLGLAYAITRVTLRVGKIGAAIRGVQNKRRNREANVTLDRDSIQQLVEEFKVLRLYFYSPRLNCLFDSLVMHRFLRSYGIEATFVIGVVVKPFRAHCWLQLEATVLNGEAEFVRGFTPIFVVE